MPAHKHPRCELVFNILQGSGKLQIGEEILAVTDGDVIHGSGDYMISFNNTGYEPTSILVVMNKGI